jgi:anaphase-promoting complex subunit 1
LSATDLYRYLSQEHEATTVGLLVGMGAARAGTMDSTVAKMLFLHIPARHPAGYPDLDVAPTVQAAALLGAGLLYRGTCHRCHCNAARFSLSTEIAVTGGQGVPTH